MEDTSHVSSPPEVGTAPQVRSLGHFHSHLLYIVWANDVRLLDLQITIKVGNYRCHKSTKCMRVDEHIQISAAVFTLCVVVYISKGLKATRTTSIWAMCTSLFGDIICI